MKDTKAFTLIELLVVVLIIGILASVALPKYQQAVSKARAMEAVTMIRSLVPALKSYMLANNSFPEDWTALDLAVNGELSKHTKENDTLTTGGYRYVLIKGRLDADRNNDAPSFLWSSQYATAFTELEPEHLYCYYETSTNKPRLEKICASLGTKEDTPAYTTVFFYKMN